MTPELPPTVVFDVSATLIDIESLRPHFGGPRLVAVDA
jgi:hypothetical protein